MKLDEFQEFNFRVEVQSYVVDRRLRPDDEVHDDAVDYLDNWLESKDLDRQDEELWNQLITIVHSTAGAYEGFPHGTGEKRWTLQGVTKTFWDDGVTIDLGITPYLFISLTYYDVLELLRLFGEANLKSEE